MLLRRVLQKRNILSETSEREVVNWRPLFRPMAAQLVTQLVTLDNILEGKEKCELVAYLRFHFID